MTKTNEGIETGKKPVQSRNAMRAFLLLLTMLLIWGGANALFSRREQDADFLWIWLGNKLILEGTSPYSAESTLALQQALTGEEIAPDQYQHPIPFPAYSAFILFPSGLLPYSTAYHIWRNLQFPMLFAALYLMKRFLNLEMRWAQEHFFFFAGSIGFLYPIVSYALGQISIFIFFLFSLLFYFSQRKMTFLAGASMAFIAIRPDMFILACVTLVVILWDARQALFKIGFAAFAVLLVFNLATLPLIGFWYVDWIDILRGYSAGNPFAHYPLEMLPNTIGQVIVVAAVIIYLAWQVLRFIKKRTESETLLLVSSTVIVFSLANKLTGTYHMTLLLIPALILLHLYSNSKLRWLVWLTMLSPWAYWYTPSGSESKDWLSSLIVPLCFLSLQVIYLLIVSPIQLQANSTHIPGGKAS